MPAATRTVLGPATLALVVWGAHFGALYALPVIACAPALAPRAGPIIAGVGWLLTAAASAATAAIMVRAMRRLAAAPPANGGVGCLADTVAATLAALGTVAIVFHAVGVLLAPPCR